mgnify:CR=1 FL=1
MTSGIQELRDLNLELKNSLKNIEIVLLMSKLHLQQKKQLKSEIKFLNFKKKLNWQKKKPNKKIEIEERLK